jgi:hypothetical protein
MQRSREFFLPGIFLVIVLLGVASSTVIVSAQSATGSFNPQTQFHVGSMIFRSVYGVATVRVRNQTGASQPPRWNQAQQNLPTYNASITIDVQITGDTGNGGMQFTVQGGVMVISTSTIAITGGNGEVSGIDRIFMEGTATSADGQSFNWHMDGLAALFNGALISELTGNASVNLGGVPTNVIVTCLTTVS